MSDLPRFHDAETRARYLSTLAAAGPYGLPIAEAALALASAERPRVELTRYRAHLQQIARDVAAHPGARADLPGRASALNEIILLKYGYSGDDLTYDDLQNANLMRVIDRRKGLPVALGILYIDAARAQGWNMVGLAFPGHFLIRLSDGRERLILDPFHGGQLCGAAGLRELLKATTGQDSELSPEHYAPVSDREILLRLQNNLKSRLVQTQNYERALAVIETMQLLAPDLSALWYEAGSLQVQLGKLRAALGSLEEFVARTPDGTARHQVAAMVQQLKSRLN